MSFTQQDWQANLGNLGNFSANLGQGLAGNLSQLANNLNPSLQANLAQGLGNNGLGGGLGGNLPGGLSGGLGQSLDGGRGEKRSAAEEADNFTSQQQQHHHHQQQQQHADKRQRQGTVANVTVETLNLDGVQRMAAALEPYLRKVVSEEIDRALSRISSVVGGGRGGRPDLPRLGHGSAAAHASESAVPRTMRLQYRNKLMLPLFTGGKVEGEGGSIHVVLQESSTGQLVTEGVEANLKLEIVVLEGDFNMDDDDDWTQEEFEQFIVREREGKRPLLTGDTTVQLKDGVGQVGDITFTDNSSWIRSRKFRLGVRPAGLPGALAVSGGASGGGGQSGGSSQQQHQAPEEALRVREGKTEAFTVKDHRGELYKKHYPPALNDEVWRLDRIGKDGAFHKRLNQAGIFTVEDFLRLVVMDPQKLRNILGSGMSNKMWEGTVEHAKTCVLNGKLHVYYADEKQNIGVIFNNIFQLMGLIADGQYMSVDLLSDSEKIYVDKLVKVAYENWENVVEYDGEALIGVGGGRANGAGPTSAQSIDASTDDPGMMVNRQQQLTYT